MSPDATRPAVLIIRLSAMGDIVMASGLPSSVKQHYNNKVTVSWLVETPYASLVADHPDVDNVICWPKQEWQRLASAKRYLALCRAILKFRLQLRQYRFDLVIDPQGLLKSALLGWLSGAPKRIGFNSKERSQWLLSHAFDKPQSNKISSEYAFLAAQFSHRPYRLSLGITDTERNALDRKLHQVNIKQNYITLAPFTTRPQKHWLNNHWKALISQLTDNGYQVVILGGPGDKDDASALADGIEHCVSLAGDLSLTQSAAAIQGSKALIGVDTGLTHMGTVFHRPTIALFGSTRPYTFTDSAKTKVLFAEMECAPCKRRPSCDGRFDCMRALTPDRVFDALNEVVG